MGFYDLIRYNIVPPVFLVGFTVVTQVQWPKSKQKNLAQFFENEIQSNISGTTYICQSKIEVWFVWSSNLTW